MMLIEFLAAAGGQENSFGFIEAMREGGPVAWSILAVLVIMSVGSFYILFAKLFEQNKVKKQGKEARAVWRANSLEEGAKKLDKNSAYRQIVEDGAVAERNHASLTHDIDEHEYVQASLVRSESSIMTKLNGGLPFLATVGATAPFVGLLGTVIGIYRALIKIGIAGQASIDAVAGPVGEALIMTAIGLFVAVPAVLAYNWLQARNKSIQGDLNAFGNEVFNYITSDGKVKPAASAAGGVKPATAKPAAAAKPAGTGATGGVQTKP